VINHLGVRSVTGWPTIERARSPRVRPVDAGCGMADASGDDAELIARSRRGDQAAFGALVARYQEVAFRAAFVVLRDADDAADAAQQGFIKAFRALGRFRDGLPFRPWLVRIVTNEAVSAVRSAAARARLATRLGGSSGSEPSPEEVAVTNERRELLLAALDRAREDDRLVIMYRYFLDMSEAEMAVALECPPGTVKSRLSRALGRLREELDR
jgi:RNA polymerase sigma factor (sigma-70 family)